MTSRSLQDCRILVVEDEYMLAEDLARELEDAGATVIGPAPTVDQGFALLVDPDHLDGAILDVNLRGVPVFPLADAVLAKNIPLVFTTGYDESAMPERFSNVVRCEKPINMRRIANAIGKVIHPAE